VYDILAIPLLYVGVKSVQTKG